jgi:hypothetical protein
MEKKFCKGCHADVTKHMMCICGEFPLTEKDVIVVDISNEEAFENILLVKPTKERCDTVDSEGNRCIEEGIFPIINHRNDGTYLLCLKCFNNYLKTKDKPTEEL